jgi:hypothetical protein
MQVRNQRMSLTEYWTGFWNVLHVVGHERPAFCVAAFCSANRFARRLKSGWLITPSWVANFSSMRRIKL